MKNNYSLRASFFVNACFGLNGLGEIDIEILRKNDILPDLGNHIENIINWCEKLKFYMQSIKSGVVGRIECVYNIVNLNMTEDEKEKEEKILDDDSNEKIKKKNENYIKDHFEDVMQNFQTLLNYVLDKGVIIKSIGNWWERYVEKINYLIITPLIKSVMNKQEIFIFTSRALEKPLILNELIAIYDLEQILLYWLDQTGNKKSIKYDSSRVNKIYHIIEEIKLEKQLNIASYCSQINNYNCLFNEIQNCDNSNILHDITDLISVNSQENMDKKFVTLNNDSYELTATDVTIKYKDDPIFLAIKRLANVLDMSFKWFDKNIINRRGYLNCVGKYCYYMIQCAPENELQRKLMLDHSINNLIR